MRSDWKDDPRDEDGNDLESYRGNDTRGLPDEKKAH